MHVDIAKLRNKNRIKDKGMLLKVSAVSVGVVCALFLTPLHGQEAAWFTFLGMLCLCLLLSPHDSQQVLSVVEWDVLFFFASLFVLVESIAELGVIRVAGDGIANLIKKVDMNYRLAFGMLIILWTSSMGSAFLESLPYTTTVCYILLDLKTDSELGISTRPLAFALSVGACVGGIGSIMGSSANLVAMGISKRYLGPTAPSHHQIHARDFLKHGFPVLLILTIVASVYHWIVFVVMGLGDVEDENEHSC